MANNEFNVKMDSRRGSSGRSGSDNSTPTPIPNRRYVSSPRHSSSRSSREREVFGPRSSSFRINRERISPFDRRASESCRQFDRPSQLTFAENARNGRSSTRLFNGGVTPRRAISVDDQLNSLHMEQQQQSSTNQPFKQPSTRTLNTRLMSEMRRRLIQLKDAKGNDPVNVVARPPASIPGLEDLHGNYSSLTGVATISLSAESDDFVYTPGQVGSEKSPRFRERLSRQLMY